MRVFRPTLALAVMVALPVMAQDDALPKPQASPGERYLALRIAELELEGATTLNIGKKLRADLTAAEAKVKAAEAELEKAKARATAAEAELEKLKATPPAPKADK